MFWERYESLCKRIGKKPSRVAAEIGFSSTMVTRYKNGSTPNGEILVKVADYFSCTVDYLLGHDAVYDSDSAKEDKATISAFAELSESDKKVVSAMIESLRKK